MTGYGQDDLVDLWVLCELADVFVVGIAVIVAVVPATM